MKYNLEDLEEIRDYEDIERFVLFEDKKGKAYLFPYIGEFIVDYSTKRLRCQDVECYCSNLHCIECPLADYEKLNPGEFKILKPKNKRSEKK